MLLLIFKVGEGSAAEDDDGSFGVLVSRENDKVTGVSFKGLFMRTAAKREVCVFATYGNSLKTWAEAGILDRELKLYEKYAERGLKVNFISYGGSEDLELAKPYIQRPLKEILDGMYK